QGIQVTVHNIGSADATAFSVRVQNKPNGTWATIAKQECSGLAWPKDFTPRTTRFEIPIDRPHLEGVLRILLISEGQQFDVNESNNSCLLE
ncbi:MAG: hypothetical protein KA354_24805, partial [Phycisphaerae bacterium]|nr:hypothetical protein [Phycisphaerae bacterium]